MESVRKVYQYAEPNLTVIGWMGFLGYPAYYYVWQYLFPQPYESLSLRIVCSLLFAVIALRQYLPAYLQRYLPGYFAFSVPICLPFFFSYMMFKNDWSEVWVMSFMASIIIHVLVVYRTGLLLLQTTLAFIASIFLAYGSSWNTIQEHMVWSYVAIFAFTYVFGNLFHLRSQIEHESRVSLAKSFGAGIAHEMRNPLSALKASLDVLESLLPLSQAKQSKQKVGVYELDDTSLKLAHEVILQANEAIRSGTETIDLLLTSIDQNRITNATYRKHSMQLVTQQALASFSYPSPADRLAIQPNLKEDFFFLGSDTLIKYALYNLLKNAFFHGKRDKFNITVELRRFNGFNQLILRDNGVGMSSEVSKQIFDDFYTQGKAGGYGLGLPFCLKVMRAIGGEIRCRSEVNEFTEFTLTFPPYESPAVNKIKLDMLKNKSVLYIGESIGLLTALDESSFYLGFNFKSKRLSKALKKAEYEFEYDIIFVDLDEKLADQQVLAELESKLSFTQGRLVYLYDKKSEYRYDLESSIEFCPVEKAHCITQCSSIIDELIFDSPPTSRKLDLGQKSYHGKTLLLADDNHSMRAYTAILMQKYGFTVIEAQNGQEALERLQQSKVDLIVMDIEMPIMDGLTAAKEIRRMNSPLISIPIIGYTGDSSAEMARKIHRSGINDYLIKPANSENLMLKVSKWL
ncbi:hybrid sensor histidine kinase/response regulator [Vibrio ponticus]|uniref:histidine kinase n=1 Tax=Vibrio ponticus TaxID=265668 RepID=A0ABX3F9I4_9VIBR|nr:hybrid sensor histidine kinase/response regulator [Vibrio ponticus]OLQ85494.1 hybrid sensor histidine kinase/response regulator [Vibrio ponticus]